MNQQKGFSLIEVLVSLMLVTTVALALLHQQDNLQQIVQRMEIQAGASKQHDQINEALFVTLNAAASGTRRMQ